MVSGNFMAGDCSLGVTLTLLFRDRLSDTEMSSVDMLFRDRGGEGRGEHESSDASSYLCGYIPEAAKMKHYLTGTMSNQESRSSQVEPRKEPA